MATIDIQHCARAFGRGVRGCVCMRANEGGFDECPPEARGIIPPRLSPQSAPRYSGDICATCGGLNMVRTGTCMTCQDCGSSDGGCS